MANVFKSVGRLLGVPKAPKVKTTLTGPEEDKKPAPLPLEDEETVRAAVLEREMLARLRKGRASTMTPGRTMGSYPTTLG